MTLSLDIVSLFIAPIITGVVAALATVFIQSRYTIEMKKWEYSIDIASIIFNQHRMFLDALIEYRNAVANDSKDVSDKLNEYKSKGNDLILSISKLNMIKNISTLEYDKSLKWITKHIAEMFTEGQIDKISTKQRHRKQILVLLKSEEFSEHLKRMDLEMTDQIKYIHNNSPNTISVLINTWNEIFREDSANKNGMQSV